MINILFSTILTDDNFSLAMIIPIVRYFPGDRNNRPKNNNLMNDN